MTRSLVVLVAVVGACHSAPAQKTQAVQAALLTPQPEQELTQAAGHSLQLGTQTHVQLASDGTDFLAVWIGGPGQLVQATRIAADDTVLDVPPLNVTASSQAECAVAFDGQDYVIAYRSDAAGGPTPLASYLQRVSTAGAVTGAPILIASPTTQLLEQSVYLACAARVCDVTWTDVVVLDVNDSLFQVKSRGFDMVAGVPLVPELLLADSGTPLRAMTPAASGTQFLITMGSDDGGMVVIPPGAARQQPCIQSSAGSDAFGAAGSPDGGAFIAFVAGPVAGTRLDAAGNAVDGCGNFLAAPGVPAAHPHVAWSGTDWFVAWWNAAGAQGIGFARVSDATGAVTASGAPITVPPDVYGFDDEVHPACSATGCAAAWTDGRGADGPMDHSARFARIGDDGGSLDGLGTLLAVAENGQRWPSAAWDGTQFLVAWTEYRDETRNVYAAHVGADGQTLDAPGAALAPGTSRQERPAVACSGTDCLAAWVEDGQRLAFAHLQGDAGAGALPASVDNFTVPSLAGLNGSFAVAYGVNGEAWLQLLDSDAGAQLIASTGPAPAITSNGQGWLVAWQDILDVRVRRVATDGTFIDSPTSLATVDEFGSSSVAAATDGTDSFVLWTNMANVFGAVVPGDGGAPGPVRSLGQATGFRIAAAASPEGWQGVWTGFIDGGFGVISATVPFDGGSIRTALVATSPFALTDEASLAPGPARALVLFERGDLDAGTFRIHDVLLVEGSSGTPCSAASDCVSGFCVDGVCCDTPCGGGDPKDCLSCATGTCTVLGPTHVCRGVADLCDVAESCDGDAGTCPADVFAAAAVVCRASAGPCDLADSCTGTSAACPADAFAGATVVCRPGASLCDATETCSGTGVQCPADVAMPDGTACSGTDRCFHAFSCQGGACTGGTPVVCAASDACHVAGTCDSTTGQCSNPAAPGGTACDDGDACTKGDACFGGVCAGTAVTCPAPDECHVSGVCQPPHGTCSVVPKADGASCSNGTCMAGKCVSPNMPAPSGCGCGASEGLGVLLALAASLRRRRAS